MATKKRRKKTALQAAKSEVGYSGKVTVETVRNGVVCGRKSFHNSGTSAFFRLIANAIAKNDMSSAMPQFVMGFNVASGSSNLYDTKTFVNIVPASTRAVVYNKSTLGYDVQLQFTVPCALISQHNATNELVLYGQPSMQTPLAYISLGDDAFTGDGRSNQIITWILSVRNA